MGSSQANGFKFGSTTNLTRYWAKERYGPTAKVK